VAAAEPDDSAGKPSARHGRDITARISH
jgi:hypothetical protein